MVYNGGCWLNDSATAVAKAREIVPCRLTDVVNYPPQPEHKNMLEDSRYQSMCSNLHTHT